MKALLLAMALTGFGCGTIDSRREASHDGALVPIPEPMVFDLVRGLGARKGELEFNALAILPTKGDDPYAPLIAPEVEYAAADGLAFELELPFEDDGLAAIKVAAQWTFGADPEAGFIHGTQLLVERLLEVDGWDVSLLYIPAWRFDETWSLLTMFGATALTGPEVDDEAGGLANATLFARLTERWLVGFEVNSVLMSDGNSVLLMPQAHFDVSEHFTVQFGAGAYYQHGKSLGPGPWPPESPATGWFPQLSLRLILEF